VPGTIAPPGSDNRVPTWFNITGNLQRLPEDRIPYLTTELTGRDGVPVWDTQKCHINRVWPAQLPAVAGAWATRVALGEDNPRFVGSVYKVTLLLVDTAVDKQFRDYIEQAIRTRKYPGVGTDTFAGAIEEVASIELTRRTGSQ
jgi:hypothetical protein